MKWGEINCMEMEDEIKRLMKTLKDMKSIDRRSNVFMGIQEELKKWNTFLPLLTELKDPAMETEDGRHWKKLKELVKQDFTMDDGLEL